ncbi:MULTISPECIES: iron transporter [Pseudoalteromonas]|jgi:high-affinity iron transporter|uniref:iron transporter n=1 Tax=Pseudoalteromonas TaxID=53246 RepID=UPI001FB5279F|nr:MULTISPECIES: iron transporter [Pseudoalteromonas]MDP2485493.1 iron transporter [Pseudoalteromonas marina]UOB75611.1 iron transporter [Pseudoalteromonas sp. APM04]
MLITSLVMSLNQLLPVAILLILLQVVAKQSLMKLLGGLILGIGLSFLFVKSAPLMSPLFDYQGLEYAQIGLCILIFISALYYAIKQATAAFMIAIISVMTLYLSHYIIYLIGFWQSNEAAQSLFIGTFLGLGICSSFSVLLYFLLSAIKQRFGLTPLLVLLALNSAAKLVVALDLASQIDLIPTTVTVWDLRDILTENSEFGRVLRALIGYEATPNLTSFLSYVLSSVLFLSASYFIPKSITKEKS